LTAFKNGGYQYLDATNNFIPVAPGPGGTTNYYQTGVSYPEIQSGQTFFVQAVGNNNTGTFSFDENVKSGNSRIVTRLVTPKKRPTLWAGLYSNTGICDGTSITFDKSYSNDIAEGDAGKLPNPGENFMISKENGTGLAIEKRQPVSERDTIRYSFSNLREIEYHLVFSLSNFKDDGIKAMLVDNYLKMKKPLSFSDSSFIDFKVNGSNESYENRFMVVFEKNSTPAFIADAFGSDKFKQTGKSTIKVYPNPTENKTIKIVFVNQLTGKYHLQLINDLGQVCYNNAISINNANTTKIIKLDNSIATGNYQLNIVSPDGKRSVQQIIVR